MHLKWYPSLKLLFHFYYTGANTEAATRLPWGKSFLCQLLPLFIHTLTQISILNQFAQVLQLPMWDDQTVWEAEVTAQRNPVFWAQRGGYFLFTPGSNHSWKTFSFVSITPFIISCYRHLQAWWASDENKYLKKTAERRRRTVPNRQVCVSCHVSGWVMSCDIVSWG